MKNIYDTNSPLFDGLNEKEISYALNCLDVKEKEFPKGSYIWHDGDSADYFGIVVKGQINIIKEDILGNRIVISSTSPSQVFGEAFCIGKVDAYEVSAQAVVDSTVLLIRGEKITSVCSNACSFHKKIIDNMLKLVAKKNLNLNNRIHCITKKTTKEKLLFYLVSEMHIDKKTEVTIPFNREELANYLAVNRSALSRELSELQKEGIISYHRDRFKLLDIKKLQEVYFNFSDI
ncbi:Crp/Fnr family transcriptional regulator [Clostridium cylindrosporum]|uniref:Uncharacterized protein n=1 Tax=Clostridium cylindrosporum DSM 605 TaxID=1121307 RepID=A0A0J8G2I8_CLOCY|nr:Crp/Fnr family transcriptional regulator [Clostridium cylindrosporum]KMT21941.1 hypothetical protein CLCY_3c02120 [Clostridium cylindrosporum DSM 605]